MGAGANPRRKQSKTRIFSTAFVRFALVLFFSAFAEAERLPIKTYSVADGLLRDNVFKIKQDSRGFLWFCTAEGVSRFDGYAFTNFTAADGLPDRHVNDFLETKSGAIYLATDAGIAELNPKGLANSTENPLFTVISPDAPQAKQINILSEDGDGAIWAGTSGGLYKLNGKDALEAVDLGEKPNRIDEIYINTMIRDRRGALWIGAENGGIYRLAANGEVAHFDRAEGLPDINISTLLEDKNGRIWVGLRPHFLSGLLLLIDEPHENQNIVEHYYTTKDGLPADWITSLFESDDGKFWVGTTNGLCEWQSGETTVCKTFTKENNLCDGEVWSIAEDKDKNLWTGTRCGLKKWTRNGFTTFTEADEMGAPNPNSIFETAGELFVSFNDGKIRTVSRFDGEKFSLIKPNFPTNFGSFGWGWKQTVRQTSAGDWWFPVNPGIFRFPKPAKFEDLAKITPQQMTIGTKPSEVFRFYEDSRGDLWFSLIGNAFELWRWERATDEWQNFTADAGIGKNRIAASFVEDKARNLWIGTGTDTNDAALIRFGNGQLRVFPQSENPLLAGWMRDLYVDSKGRLWIADTTNGVLRLDDVNAETLNFTNYTTAEGLASIGVSCLTEDEFGRIYIGSGRGLDRLNPETGQVENFTTADGLPNSNVEIAYRDRRNNLWFGTTDGLARLVPESARERQPPNALITNLRVNGESQSVSVLGETAISPLGLNSEQKQISVDFVGLGASLGEKLKYEYRFGDADWTQTNERTVNFANLAAGEYKFEVRARTADRIYSQPSTVSFRIASPIWQRWWFIVLAAVLVGLIIYFTYRNRLKRLLEMERMRTRIATDLHDDIGANLTRIALLSEVANQQAVSETVKNLLPSIAGIARESVASMNDIVWAIAPEHDSLLDLTRRMRSFAEEVFALRDIDLAFDAPTADTDLKLSVGVRRDVLLIFKEAVNNAARHSECTKVAIDFRVEHAKLFLQIKDNGTGFAPDSESDGQGLRSMSRRAKVLGGNLTIESNDGTTVKFELVLAKNSRI